MLEIKSRLIFPQRVNIQPWVSATHSLELDRSQFLLVVAFSVPLCVRARVRVCVCVCVFVCEGERHQIDLQHA